MNREGSQKYLSAMAVMTLLFFMWGFMTALNDILVPYLKSLYHLDYARAMLVQFCFFAAYAIMSIPMSAVVKKFWYKKGIVVALIISGIGCLLFIPSAHLGIYSFFLVSLFVLATGIVLLQVAANPFVTLLGKPENASSRLSFAQGVNSLAYIIAPLFGAFMILSVKILSTQQIQQLTSEAYLKYKQAIISAIQIPYLELGITFFVIAFLFLLIKFPKVTETTESNSSNHSTAKSTIWQYPHLIFGAFAIFLYVGAEVTTGSFIVNYLGLPQIANMSAEQAAKYVSIYWGGAMIGRFIGSWILTQIKPSYVVVFNAFSAIVLLVISILASGHLSMWCILALGLCNSILFPTIFSLSLSNLGKFTSYGSGILCTAIVGGAIVPVLQGILADQIGAQNSFVLLIFCYLAIVIYGWWIHKKHLAIE